ncbi:MAG: YfiR family protein [bacterium]|nr:YfiR family protein [bacterium]
MVQRLAMVGCLGLLLCAAEPSAAQDKPSEYQVKAAFLLNFARFVEWPEGTNQDTLRIGIVGTDPFGDAFQTILGQSPGGQPVQVMHPAAADLSAVDCHILFVSNSASRELDRILLQTHHGPMLTVGDMDGFARAGGMVGFILRNNKIRFQINSTAATRANLRLSAKLLRLAEIVDDGGDDR